jgi:hypothetical protein
MMARKQFLGQLPQTKSLEVIDLVVKGNVWERPQGNP